MNVSVWMMARDKVCCPQVWDGVCMIVLCDLNRSYLQYIKRTSMRTYTQSYIAARCDFVNNVI